MNIEIVPCKLAHLRELVSNMRLQDAMEAGALGKPCRHMLVMLWKNTANPRAALIDGKVAAAWGCCSQLLVSEGEPWLFTTPVVERAPVRFLKQARREVLEMLLEHRTLVSSVASDYIKAVNFLRKLGFSINEEHKVGPQALSFRAIRMER